ncbi:hypothetical protein ACN4EK_21625 [Pantanalinema rosaneae CENA516]|uniref:hypothetical protein n=1 Tax=Pantanalinema rosaneae TaxID=1620701 RepID=UPI003D6F29F7
MIMHLTQNSRSALHCQPSRGSMAAVALLAFVGGLADINFRFSGKPFGGNLANGRTALEGIWVGICVAILGEQNPDRLIQSGRYRRLRSVLT